MFYSSLWTWAFTDLNMHRKQIVNTSNKQDKSKKNPLAVHRSINISLPEIKKP